ncbi:cell wall binding repeat 2 family protein [Clostridioides difficile 6041]|uniref:S-layer protein SlpA n=1 Tax=Clostridioides difficile TaxID=1496 RepID=UPI00038D2A2A|nr:S-layer protein SlpA [Clostridioides difficile]EQG01435.1 cell wall binding repeat 2 family protein [Clostridioides difficile 6041]
MNKKNIAIAMSGLTVLASAAPVFADDTKVETGDQGYTVVQSKYKKAVEQLQKGILDGSITEIKVFFEGTLASTIKVGSELNAADASKLLFTQVDNKLDNLGDGDYVDFLITSPGQWDKITTSKLVALKDLTGASADAIIAGTSSADGVVTNTGAASGSTETNSAGTKLAMSAIFDTAYTDSSETAVKITIKADMNDTKFGKAGETTYSTGLTFEDGSTEKIVKLGDSDIIDITKALKLTVVPGSKATVKFAEKTPSASVQPVITKLRIINAKEETIDIDASSSKTAQDLAKKYVFNKTDLNTLYKVLNGDEADTNGLIEEVSGKYQVVLYPEGKRVTTKSAAKASIADENSPVKLTLKSDKKKDLKDYVDDLRTYNNGYSNAIEVAGEDRIETAIALSQKYYNSDDENAIFRDSVDNVVLVGGNAIVDGLVASPLASEKKAPLLLTSKDKLDSSVKAEIKRVMNIKSTTGINTSKKVYLAGGVNSISKEVENELKDMGLKVTRLAGDDRYETSLKIADEVGLDNDKAFVVGGTGLADAMSIAPVASQLRNANGKMDLADGDATPIVVVDGKAKTINDDVKDFLDDSQVDIIGGENSVSKDVENAIDDATGKSPDRYSGDDRQATNAKVIKESSYYQDNLNNDKKVVNFFVAKDGSTKEDQLVDALAAAPVAANFGVTLNSDGRPVDKDGKVLTGSDNDKNKLVSPAPIVLATDSLSSDQSVSISKVLDKDNGENLVQVGKGIATSVINKLKDLLSM